MVNMDYFEKLTKYDNPFGFDVNCSIVYNDGVYECGLRYKDSNNKEIEHEAKGTDIDNLLEDLIVNLAVKYLELEEKEDQEEEQEEEIQMWIKRVEELEKTNAELLEYIKQMQGHNCQKQQTPKKRGYIYSCW